MLAGGHGDPNPNASWLDSRGLWLAYVLGMVSFHIILLAIPFVQIPYAWTITNVSHNLAHLYFLHSIKGAPWMSIECGENRKYTHWEQIDYGEQFTTTKKFLTAAPIVLFVLSMENYFVF
ncbi:AGAP010566-PA-like protein [Anopheles sinensis]|uniref:AGAP010566-PA-like protein n=1 Tax=Anopheles sinensis TaxID=74873 RepID=A0A084VKX2_ANOSI|nr:AGAP010566-PA-like protein [Anopheles sinensis]